MADFFWGTDWSSHKAEALAGVNRAAVIYATQETEKRKSLWNPSKFTTLIWKSKYVTWLQNERSALGGPLSK